MSETLRIGSLFSGYGGLEMGVQAALGGEVLWHSEIDANASKILAHHWPDIPNLGDITAVDWSTVEPVDIITGGFPCQDVSVAGLRRGVRPGTRSGLWAHFALAIDQLRPSLVIIENVGGLLSADAHSDLERDCWCLGDAGESHLRALGAVLGDLASLGFDAEWGGLRAAQVGAPHGRLRIFVIAYPAGDTANVIGPRAVASRDRGGRPEEQAGDSGSAAADSYVAGLEGRLLPAERGGERAAGAGGVEAEPRLLSTPTAADGKRIGPSQRAKDHHSATTVGEQVLALLPTIRATRGGSSTEIAAALGGEVDYSDRPQGRMLLPTPDASHDRGILRSREGDYRPHSMLTDSIARLLPTPTQGDGEGGGKREGVTWDDTTKSTGEGGASRLRDVAMLLPTPKGSDGPNGGPGMRNGRGVADALPAVAMLLPTPTTMNRTSEKAQTGRETSGPQRGGPSYGLEDVVVDQLLPTPKTGDNRNSRVAITGANSDRHGRTARGSASGLGLEQALEVAQGILPKELNDWSELPNAQLLLPTPMTSYSQRDAESWRDGRPAGNGQRREAIGDLEIALKEAQKLLPTPSVADGMGGHLTRSGDRSDELLLKGIAKAEQFGPYAIAIARWERILGRPAPPPTEPNSKGLARLSARFVEFMMGLPEGHVTDVAGLGLPAQLKALGNGVVPQQAAMAVALLLERSR